MRRETDATGEVIAHQVCLGVVQDLMARYGWRLLSADALVERVLNAASSAASPAELERLAKHHYTLVLYEACRQEEQLDRQEQGYYELFRFLFRVAHNRWPDLAEDVTQRALVLIYEQIDRCRSPGAFLAFALNKLRHAFQQEQRARDHSPPPEPLAEDGVPSPSVSLDHQERAQVLIVALHRLPDERQREVIVLKFFGGLSDEAMGYRLGITAGYVRVLRHRGIARLREDETLKAYFATGMG